MIVFTPIRTRRITAAINELTAEAAIFLCKLRHDLNEAGTTELLKRIVEDDPRPRPGQVVDVRLWTVQERALVVSHYIAHTNDGDPNFAIGGGHYSDYLMESNDSPPEFVAVGEIGGDKWRAFPLLGIHAESIERLVATGRIEGKRHGWWIGAMAAQLCRDGEDFDHASMTDAELDDHIAERVGVIISYPESSFIRLLNAYLAAVEKLDHVFRLEFCNDGIAFGAKEAGMPPARFPFDSAVSDAAKAVFGNT